MFGCLQLGFEKSAGIFVPLAATVKPSKPKMMQWVPATGQESHEAISCHNPLPAKYTRQSAATIHCLSNILEN
jgi:hypothetical protein